MKIAFVGAGGYKNIGDDTYHLVFREQFPDQELLFYNSDLPRTLPEDIGLFVVGGGGVVHNVGAQAGETESPHFRCMRFYLDQALQRGVPFGFLSCGFQFPNQSPAPDSVLLQPWARYLREAAFLTMRSPACRQIAVSLSGREDCHWYPDAGYLYRPFGDTKCQPEEVLTLVPAGTVSPPG